MDQNKTWPEFEGPNACFTLDECNKMTKTFILINYINIETFSIQ